MGTKISFSGVVVVLLHYLIAVFFPHLQPDEPFRDRVFSPMAMAMQCRIEVYPLLTCRILSLPGSRCVRCPLHRIEVYPLLTRIEVCSLSSPDIGFEVYPLLTRVEACPLSSLT